MIFGFKIIKIIRRWIFFIPCLGFLIFFYYFPVSNFIALNLVRPDVNIYFMLNELIKDYSIRSAFAFTFWQALVSAILSVLLGFPGAYIISQYDFRGKNLVISILMIPFVLPPIVVGFSFLMIYYWALEPIASYFKIGSMEFRLILILLAHVFYNAPLSTLIIGSFWSNISSIIEDVKRVYSSSKTINFFRVTLPLLMPSIALSFILSFMFCFLSFDIILLLGAGYFKTIELEIYVLYTTFFNLKYATLLVVIQLLIISTILLAYFSISERVVRGTIGIRRTYKRISDESPLKKLILYAYLSLYLGYQAVPLAISIFNGFFDPVKKRLTLEGFIELFSMTYNIYLRAPPIMAVVNTLTYALASSIITVVLAIITGKYLATRSFRSASYGVLMFLPLATSRITLSLSYIATFGRIGLLEEPTFLIIALHVLIAYPFATRIIISSYRSIDKEVFEAADLYGRGLAKIRRVEIPLLKSSIMVAIIFAASTSIGEFATSNLIARGKYLTLTILLYLMISSRKFVVAGASASLLIMTTLILFYTIIKVSKRVYLAV